MQESWKMFNDYCFCMVLQPNSKGFTDWPMRGGYNQNMEENIILAVSDFCIYDISHVNT